MKLHPLLLPLALLALVACGPTGTSEDSGPTPMAPALARKATNDMLTLEGAQASATALPVWAPTPEGTSLAFSPGTAAGCITKDAPTTDGSGFTHVLSHYSCNGSHGGTLAGTVENVFKNDDYTLVYNLTATVGTLTWEYTGSRLIALNPLDKTSAITAAITVVAKNSGAVLATETYQATWTADWNTANTYKLWGAFTLARSGQETLSGTVGAGMPLVWTSSCCHPGSGTVTLLRGTETALVTFNATCGRVTLTLPGSGDAAVTLPDC